MQLLFHASEPDGITLFHDLSSLKFCGDLTCAYAWHALRILIGQAPKLQILAFELTYQFPCAYIPPKGFLEEPLDGCHRILQLVIMMDFQAFWLR